MPDSPFILQGELDTGRVAEAWRASRKALSSGRIPQTIDLGEIRQTDSATLALLLEWQAKARLKKKQIEFTNPPESLMVLARLSNVQDLLGWEAAESSLESALEPIGDQ